MGVTHVACDSEYEQEGNLLGQCRDGALFCFSQAEIGVDVFDARARSCVFDDIERRSIFVVFSIPPERL